MRSLQQGYAVECDGIVVPAADLSPEVRAILERMARVAHVLDQHRIAVARHSQHLRELQAELEVIERRP